MYLFSRRARIAPGHTRDALTWAVGITEHVNRVTELQVSLFARTLSPHVGTIAWSTFVPDLAMLEVAEDKLMTDDTYVTAVDTGAMMTTGGIDDALMQLVHGEPDPNRSFEYVTSVHAVCANGALARGMSVGVQLAQLAEKITGVPTLFAAGATGPYGAVAWYSAFEDIAAMERAQQALMTSGEWMDMIDREAGTAYAAEPSITQTLCSRRVA